MARMRQALSPSACLEMINSMIDGTQTQRDLIAFKSKHSHPSGSTVGVGYYHGFMKRNEHLLTAKRGSKYELDRDRWTTYANFDQMYDHIYDELVDAKVAYKLNTPIWLDINGNPCHVDDSFGCKVTHSLLTPEMCIVMDEVGGNTSQKGDGHIGGELLICAKGMEPQKKINVKDKHFTLLGLTALNGDPVMCVIIFAGKREQAVVETGMDVFAEEEGEVSDEDFLNKNSGPNKRFPGGPTCSFQGKDIPCLTQWSPKGSITGEILTDILATLDYHQVFDRSERKKPFLLLDGHGSRFAHNFLKYIMHPDHSWSVCIGVPYGTALWQVGDSSEQNGAYKVALTKAKENLIKQKHKKMMKLTIEPYEIIPLVNHAWAQSFARPISNRKAIAERGWNPLNRNLLLNTTLRATMTNDEKQNEIGSVLIPKAVQFIPTPSTSLSATCTTLVTTCTTLATTCTTLATITNAPSTPRFDPAYIQISDSQPREKMNYASGTAAFCLESIVKNSDLQNARERIKREQKIGKTISERILEQKGAITAGKLFQAGSCRIGKTVFDLVNTNADNIKRAAKEKGEALKVALLEKIRKANKVRELGKPNDKLTIGQLKILLAPLKRTDDKKLPTKKNELIALLVEWGARGAVVVEEEVAIAVANEATKMRLENLEDAEVAEENDPHSIGMVEEV